MDDKDIRKLAEGEKHFKLDNRETVYFGTEMSVLFCIEILPQIIKQ